MFCLRKALEKLPVLSQTRECSTNPVKVEETSDRIVVSVAQSLCCSLFHTELSVSVYPSTGAEKGSADVPEPSIYDSIEKEVAQKEVQSERSTPESETQVPVATSPDTPPA